MTGLVRLYPKAWRDRYEDEFVELLEARPPRWATWSTSSAERSTPTSTRT